ncbi:MAG: hypothetical protein ACW98G_18285, partial [Candidatus Hodarchaeales archaeon]
MKQMKDDAKVLIRSYIDSIEEYLKFTCKMHPNEIDTLLNEINDFMYIRSNELATGKTILHSDVLQAMEECGSPSEICDQYLETENDEPSQIHQGKTVLGSKQIAKKTKSSSFRNTHFQRNSRGSTSSSYLTRVQNFKFFAIYRLFAACIFTISIITVIITPFGYQGQTSFSYGNLQNLIDNYFTVVLMWIVFFLFFEGWLIPKWKGSLASKGFPRVIDNGIMITISRVGFLVLIFKASLLPLPWKITLIFPILVIFQTLLERQLRSHLWITRLSPFLIKIARSVDNNEFISDTKRGFNNWSATVQTYPANERITLLLGGAFLFFSFFFSWGYGWADIIFIRSYYYFMTERLLPVLAIHLLIVSIIIIALIAVSFSSENEGTHSNNRLNSVSFWIGRILGIRTLMMVTAYYYEYFWSYGIFLTLLLLIVYVFYESTAGFQRHVALKKSIVSGLQYLGQDPVSTSPRKELSISSNLISPPSAEVRSVSRSFQQPSSPEPISVSNQESVISPPTPIDPLSHRKSRSKMKLLVTFLYTILTPVFIFTKALIIALFLLFGTVYEVVLFILIVLTGRSVDGSFSIPSYSFTSINSSDTYQLGGFTIWSWYLLGALAVQVFIIVVIAWFQFARKRPDGLIIIFFRNFS